MSTSNKVMRSMENMINEIVKERIMECSVKYKFDGEEAIREMGINNVKSVKNEKRKEMKIIWPFSKENVCKEGCQGLKYNQGLFTQCEKKKKEGGEYCESCEEEGEKSGKGIPDCGTVGERLSKGLMEFRDPKGRSPVEYLKVIKKKNWSVEDIKQECLKKNYKIDEEHFVNKMKEKRGRPKKVVKEVESSSVITDLFANIVEEASNDIEMLVEEEVIEEKKEEKKVEKKEEKEEAKKAKELEKEAAKKAKELEKEAVKKAKELEKEAAKKAKELEKEEAKKAKEAAKKEKKDAKKDVKKEEKNEEKKAQAVEEVGRPKITVSRIEIDGKKYLKSSANILYDPDTKEEMGLYCEEKKSLIPLPENDEEEVEEEYESDSD